MAALNPWIEIIGVAMFAFLGMQSGRWFSRLSAPYWTFGFFGPLSLILLIVVIGKIPALMFLPPTSWLARGRAPFAVIGFVAAMILTTPLRQLPNLRTRMMVNILMLWIVIQVGLWPFIAPALNGRYLASLRTNIDADGVCRQSNEYTCGPAAAVTALRKLGFPAEEGEIAILARTSSAAGTPPALLATALRKRYGADGLVCEYRLFNDISELKSAGLTLAVIKYGFLVDHFVAILRVTDNEITIGDPLCGIKRISHREFQNEWRRLGIVIKRR